MSDTPDETEDPAAAQIRMVWKGLLSQFTAQGATRREILQTAASTAATVLEVTAENMWPVGEDGLAEQEVPDNEVVAYSLFSLTIKELARLGD